MSVSIRRLSLVVEFSLWVREVTSSILVDAHFLSSTKGFTHVMISFASETSFPLIDFVWPRMFILGFFLFLCQNPCGVVDLPSADSLTQY